MNALSGIRFGPQIESAARAHGLEPKLLAAVAAQETGGPGASSGANVVGDHGHGRGLFQIDDRWHAFAGTPAAMDPAKNADYAAGMLSGLLSEYHGNVKEALSAYNAGSPTATGTVTQWADGSRLGYADSVLRHYAGLGGNPSALGGGMAAAATGARSAAAVTGPASSTASSTPAAALAPLANFQISLPQPSPYPTQYRSYASVSGLDGNGPQQIDTLMTNLIDGADGNDANGSS